MFVVSNTSTNTRWDRNWLYRLGPTEDAHRLQSPKRYVFLNKNRTVDNVQKHNKFTNLLVLGFRHFRRKFLSKRNSWNQCFTLFQVLAVLWSWDSTVSTATGYRLDDREVGVRVPVGLRIFTSPCRPERLWCPPNLLYNGYRGFIPGGKAAGAWNWPLTSN
jgi:hypothetical protein